MPTCKKPIEEVPVGVPVVLFSDTHPPVLATRNGYMEVDGDQVLFDSNFADGAFMVYDGFSSRYLKSKEHYTSFMEMPQENKPTVDDALAVCKQMEERITSNYEKWKKSEKLQSKDVVEAFIYPIATYRAIHKEISKRFLGA